MKDVVILLIFSSILNFVEEIHKNFDKPLNFSRNSSGQAGKKFSETGQIQHSQRDPNLDENKTV